MFAVSVVLLQMFCYLFCSPCCGSVNRSSLWCSKFPSHPKLVSFLTSDPVSVSWDRLGWFISIYACRKYVAIVRFYGQTFPRELCFGLGVIHLMWVFFLFWWRRHRVCHVHSTISTDIWCYIISNRLFNFADAILVHRIQRSSVWGLFRSKTH